ncbi:MAG: restriction endonuclease, partial [Methanobacteriota archaeon]
MAVKKIDWNSITDDKFEELCRAILNINGYYNIESVGGSGDRGRDLVASKDKEIVRGKKTTEKWTIQCKRWIERKPAPTDLDKTLVWAKAHNPNGVLFFIANTVTSDTHDWLEEYSKTNKIEIHRIDRIA